MSHPENGNVGAKKRKAAAQSEDDELVVLEDGEAEHPVSQKAKRQYNKRNNTSSGDEEPEWRSKKTAFAAKNAPKKAKEWTVQEKKAPAKNGGGKRTVKDPPVFLIFCV